MPALFPLSSLLPLPHLSSLLLLPLLGIALIWLDALRGGSRNAASWPWTRQIAILATALTLLVALCAVAQFDPANPAFQLAERALWIPGLNVHYSLGVDKLSILFLPATALLFLALLLTRNPRRLPAQPRMHYSLLLLLLLAIEGVFCALDTLLFFVFWELTLIPLYFLLASPQAAGNSQNGSPAAAAKYCFTMLAGGIPLLFAFILLAVNLGTMAQPLFELETLITLAEQQPPPLLLEIGIFVLLALGFGVKVPFVPLHSWLHTLALQGPTAPLALIAGLKLGVYGLLRFALPLAPHAASQIHWLLAGLGTLAVLYGAVTALAQSNLKAMLACWSVSHVGLAVLGVASRTPQGIQGSVLLLLSFVLSTGGLYLLLDLLERRTGSCDVQQLGGLAHAWPLLAGFFLCFGLAGLGMPGTPGFPAELAILLAVLKSHTGAGLAALFGLVVGAAAFLSAYRRAFFGPAPHTDREAIPDLTGREKHVMLGIALLLLVTGVWPRMVLGII